MVKTKSGEVITTKEFFKRWGDGISNITPLQKLTNEARGTFITLLGFIVSFAAVIWKRTTIGILAYGLILIFLGSIITTGLRYLGLKQQLKSIRNMDSQSINISEMINKIEEHFTN